MEETREVRIDILYNKEHKPISRVVRYVKRKKHERYFAAQFSMHVSEERVREWIAEQQNLKLVE